MPFPQHIPENATTVEHPATGSIGDERRWLLVAALSKSAPFARASVPIVIFVFTWLIGAVALYYGDPLAVFCYIKVSACGSPRC